MAYEDICAIRCAYHSHATIHNAIRLSNILHCYFALQFNEMKAQANGGNPLLTANQEQWLTIQKMLASTSLSKTFVPPKENKFRMALFKVALSKWFDTTMCGIIIINVIFMFLVRG